MSLLLIAGIIIGAAVASTSISSVLKQGLSARHSQKLTKPVVIVISSDRFRLGYQFKTVTPNIDSLIASGTEADRGVDSMVVGEPLWLTVTNHELKAAAYYWPGSEVKKGNWTCPPNLCPKTRKKGIFNDVHIILLGDHGMVGICDDKVVYLEDLAPWITIPKSWVQTHTPLLTIRPPGSVSSAYVVAKMKEGLSSGLAAEGFTMAQRRTGKPVCGGQHGYDNADFSMKTTFVGHRPEFKRGCKFPSFKKVEESKHLTVTNTRPLTMKDDVLVVAVSPDAKYIISLALLDCTIKGTRSSRKLVMELSKVTPSGTDPTISPEASGRASHRTSSAGQSRRGRGQEEPRGGILQRGRVENGEDACSFIVYSSALCTDMAFTCRNMIHGSDGLETAKDEINMWFKPEELVSYTSNAEKWVYDVN
ncbi:hypothetical protein Sjap_019844 [Stephania japonica]|uniref:Nucleoside-diphosphate kinase n=1 Tax=Stephania japonica TaxID=461633 RepID=A0AAP0F293_9MAGN